MASVPIVCLISLHPLYKTYCGNQRESTVRWTLLCSPWVGNDHYRNRRVSKVKLNYGTTWKGHHHAVVGCLHYNVCNLQQTLISIAESSCSTCRIGEVSFLPVLMERSMISFLAPRAMCGGKGDAFWLQLSVHTRWNWYVGEGGKEDGWILEHVQMGEVKSLMSNTQLLISQLQDVSRIFVNCLQVPKTLGFCSWLINSCVLLISEFHYYIDTTMSLYSIIIMAEVAQGSGSVHQTHVMCHKETWCLKL